jgi:hypothetical protein
LHYHKGIVELLESCEFYILDPIIFKKIIGGIDALEIRFSGLRRLIVGKFLEKSIYSEVKFGMKN